MNDDGSLTSLGYPFLSGVPSSVLALTDSHPDSTVLVSMVLLCVWVAKE